MLESWCSLRDLQSIQEKKNEVAIAIHVLRDQCGLTCLRQKTLQVMLSSIHYAGEDMLVTFVFFSYKTSYNKWPKVSSTLSLWLHFSTPEFASECSKVMLSSITSVMTCLSFSYSFSSTKSSCQWPKVSSTLSNIETKKLEQSWQLGWASVQTSHSTQVCDLVKHFSSKDCGTVALRMKAALVDCLWSAMFMFIVEAGK